MISFRLSTLLPPLPSALLCSLYELSGGGELWPVQEPVNRPVAHESADPRLSVTYGRTSPLACQTLALSLSPSCILSALVVTPLASLLFLSPEEREILSTFLSLLLLDSPLIP